MKEIILETLKKIPLQEFGAKDVNLSDAEIIQGIVEKSGNIGFAINIGALGIDQKQGEKLIKLCEEFIRKEIEVGKINIVLTSHAV